MRDRERLIQEDYVETPHFPWKVLVICQCLNKAGWPIVQEVVKELFEKYPDPMSCDEICLDSQEPNEELAELSDLVRCLGLSDRRVDFLIRMSRQYVAAEKVFGSRYDRYPVTEFRGCGQYAKDAWDLLVLGRPCVPNDRHLARLAKRIGLYGKRDKLCA